MLREPVAVLMCVDHLVMQCTSRPGFLCSVTLPLSFPSTLRSTVGSPSLLAYHPSAWGRAILRISMLHPLTRLSPARLEVRTSKTFNINNTTAIKVDPLSPSAMIHSIVRHSVGPVDLLKLAASAFLPFL
jgi:hypothetical protein